MLHLTAHMNLFVPVLMALAALLLDPASTRTARSARHRRHAWRRIFLLLLVNAVLFSVLGGALLTRYLLPMYPLVLVLAVTTFYRRVPYWHGFGAFSAAAFIAGLFINPPYGFAPEDNLAYARVVRMHQAGIAQLNRRYPGATVLTAWPMTDELTRPELGYVNSPGMFAGSRTSPRRRSLAPPTSRKSTPRRWSFPPSTIRRSLLLSLGPGASPGRALLRPAPRSAPRRDRPELHGTLVWKREEQGMWIALIRFNRQLEAAGQIPRSSAVAALPLRPNAYNQPVVHTP